MKVNDDFVQFFEWHMCLDHATHCVSQTRRKVKNFMCNKENDFLVDAEQDAAAPQSYFCSICDITSKISMIIFFR